MKFLPFHLLDHGEKYSKYNIRDQKCHFAYYSLICKENTLNLKEY